MWLPLSESVNLKLNICLKIAQSSQNPCLHIPPISLLLMKHLQQQHWEIFHLKSGFTLSSNPSQFLSFIFFLFLMPRLFLLSLFLSGGGILDCRCCRLVQRVQPVKDHDVPLVSEKRSVLLQMLIRCRTSGKQCVFEMMRKNLDRAIISLVIWEKVLFSLWQGFATVAFNFFLGDKGPNARKATSYDLRKKMIL